MLAETGEADPAVADARRATLSTVVDGAAGMGAQIMVNGVADGLDAPHLLVNTRLVAEGPNPLFRKSNLACKREAIDAARHRLERAPAPAGRDVFAALRTLKADLEGSEARRVDVVLLTSMLNRGVVDLGEREALREPAKAINRVARRGLNFRCTGWRVYAAGGGGDGLSPADDSRLRAFWRAYFEHCGGALVAYNTRLPQFPLNRGAIQVADTRTIPIAVERHRDDVEATLSSAVLFASGSARLRDGAQSGLEQLLPLMREQHGVIAVAGHTDDTGGDAVNAPLSRARAEAVARWLRRHGGSGRAIRTRGLGAARPVASNRTAEGRGRNRRVVVTFRH